MNMCIKRAFLLPVVVCLAAPAAQAAVTTSGCAGAGACTMAELFAGGSIRIDDVVFNNFKKGLFSEAINADPADPAKLSVSAGAGAPSLLFRADPALSVAGDLSSVVYHFSFDAAVAATSARSIVGAGFSLLDVVRNGDASLKGDVEITSQNPSLLLRTIADNLDGVTLSTRGVLAPTTLAPVLLDVALTGQTTGVSASLGGWDFALTMDRDLPSAAVPLPAPFALFGAAFGALAPFSSKRKIA